MEMSSLACTFPDEENCDLSEQSGADAQFIITYRGKGHIVYTCNAMHCSAGFCKEEG